MKSCAVSTTFESSVTSATLLVIFEAVSSTPSCQSSALVYNWLWKWTVFNSFLSRIIGALSFQYSSTFLNLLLVLCAVVAAMLLCGVATVFFSNPAIVHHRVAVF